MPVPVNRPGLDALAYRVGTYGTFVRAMTERASVALPSLKTRELDDPSIALLDGWAIVADVLTFYQERIANEGYLRTATEKRSVLEFAKLVGYTPRPGVSASVFLAYTLEKGGDVTLEPGNKAQSIPGPGQTAQTFESADPLDARDVWNALRIRTTRPQQPSGNAPFYVSSVTTNLKPNDVVLFVRPDPQATTEPERRFVRVAAVEPQPAQNRTKITLQGDGLVWNDAVARGAAFGPPAIAEPPGDRATLLERIDALRSPLLQAPSAPPRSPQRLRRTTSEVLGPDLDLTTQLFGALNPDGAALVYAALANAPAAPPPGLEVYAFRVHAAPYGHNAPAPPIVEFNENAGRSESADAETDWPLAPADATVPNWLSLDARYDRIGPGSFVGIRTFGSDAVELFQVFDVRERSRVDYGMSATTTVLTLDRDYFRPGKRARLGLLRDVDVYAQSELLHLAEVPIDTDIPENPAVDPTVLELDGIYDGLAAGRWAIVAGTRTDLPGVAGGELVMIAATEHRTNPTIPGDTVHTFVTLSTKLAYRYARGSVTFSGNVVRATHGETRKEVIGSGDASQARQSFALKAKPLTFVSSPTRSGTLGTLTVRVNGVRWSHSDDVNALGPLDRAYVTATTDAGTTVTFGDGVHGARLPTGAENVVATYRTGLGSAGNLAFGKISLLMSRPLGVKAVNNPLPAAGGADSESRDEMRGNVPTALLALDRLVSLDDYVNFARTFAGVAKAAVAQIGSGGKSTVVLTLAGPANAAIDAHGDLVANLATALRTLGDPRQAFTIATCERVLLLVGASVDLAPDALWESVEPAIRAALLHRFGFEAREFGVGAYKSEAIAAIASVDGVVDVALDLFTGITDATLANVATFAQRPVVDDVVVPLPARLSGTAISAAQYVALDPGVPDTVFLRKNQGGAAV